MGIHNSGLLNQIQISAPAGALIEFRRRPPRRRSRRRAAAHGDSLFSSHRAARLRPFLRRSMLAALCLLALVLAVVAGAAFAQDQAAPAESDPLATRIEMDEQAGVIRFFIDGQETARLDAAGLHVRENIEYGGTLTDYGHTGFDERTGWAEYQRVKAGEGNAP